MVGRLWHFAGGRSAKSKQVVKARIIMKLTIKDLYDLSHSRAGSYLECFTYPWEVLSGISELIVEIGKTLPADEYDNPSENVWIAKDAVVFPTAHIGAPCIIGHKTEVRQCAFIRGSALVGDNCVVGNSTELKNVILFDNVQVPHYNYVGDSILGYKSHMGAGSITSNVKSDKSLICIKADDEKIETGIQKVGAFLGDYAEIGCNSVLCPGSIIGRKSTIYPLSRVRGVVPSNTIYKNQTEIVERIEN